MAILHDRARSRRRSTPPSSPLDEAPQGYQDFDKGAARKYVIDPHGLIPAADSGRLSPAA